MNYYTSTIPLDLAKKLKAVGMPNIEGKDYVREPPYAEVFDWLMSNRRITIVIEPSFHELYLVNLKK